MSTDHQDLRDRIAQSLAEHTLAEAAGRRTAVDPATRALVEKIASARATALMPLITAEIGRLEAEIDRADLRADRRAADLRTQNKRIRDLENTVAGRDSRITELESRLARSRTHRADLTRKNDHLQALADRRWVAYQSARTRAEDIQVWPLARVLSDARCGSQDWTWEEEWADLDRRHAETGYLDYLDEQIQDNGITMPILIGHDGRLWDGHHRLRIAVRAGIPYVPVEVVPRATTAPPRT